MYNAYSYIFLKLLVVLSLYTIVGVSGQLSNRKAIEASVETAYGHLVNLDIICNEDLNPIQEIKYPPEVYQPEIKWEKYTQPGDLIPYLGKRKDPITGLNVTRIADEQAFGIVDQLEKRHRYSSRQSWNADGTLLVLSGSHKRILDGITYEVLGIDSSFGNVGWSPVDPLVNFYSNRNIFRVKKLDLATMKSSTIQSRTFTDYEVLDCANASCNVSNDGRLVVLSGTKPSTGDDTWLVTYNIEEDKIIAEKNIKYPFKDFEFATMSQSGKYVVVMGGQGQGSGFGQGVDRYDVNLNTRLHLTPSTRHADVGLDAGGNDVYVTYNQTDGYEIEIVRLSDGKITRTWKYSGKEGSKGISSGGHISCRNLKRPGWAYMSTTARDNDLDDLDAPLEIVAIKLDGSHRIERYGRHNSRQAMNKYYHEAHASPNHIGTKVIFASDWGVKAEKGKNYSMAHVIEK